MNTEEGIMGIYLNNSSNFYAMWVDIEDKRKTKPRINPEGALNRRGVMMWLVNAWP